MVERADIAYQEQILQGVSRTFALTIPQLPPALSLVVGNAYLLCRIADTIEDEPNLTQDQQVLIADLFVKALRKDISAETFKAVFYPLLSQHTSDAEHELIENSPRILAISHSFSANQRQALERCVEIMMQGMLTFQKQESLSGLADLPAMDNYCYYVAGVVGEMLTELFCDYSPEIAKNKSQLMKLSVSFGQALQMTNILKDTWEDRARGACWLPRDVFAKYGVDLGQLTVGNINPGFSSGLIGLLSVAKRHVANALTYTVMIPSQEEGIRKFCLWALGMAILTLRKINKNKEFQSGKTVKISRNSVKLTIGITHFVVRSNLLLKLLHKLLVKSLPDDNYGDNTIRLNFEASS